MRQQQEYIWLGQCDKAPSCPDQSKKLMQMPASNCQKVRSNNPIMATVMRDVADIFNFSLEERADTAKEQKHNYMANIKECLEDAMQIEGALGAALVDWKSGMCLGKAGGATFNIEIAAAGNTDVVRSKIKVMQSLGIRDNIEDILISLGNQYHIIRLLSEHANLFLYLVLKRDQANLALARYKLTQLDESLKV